MKIYYRILYFLILCLGMFSCSKKSNNINLNELIIVSSEEDSLYADLDGFIHNFFKTQNRYLPIEENYYNINWIQPHELEKYMDYPSILFLKLKNPKDNSGDTLFDRIFKNKNKDSKVNFINDFYSENQSIIGVESEDRVELNEIFFNYKDIIINQIDLNINELIFNKYTNKSLNNEIADKIKNKYGVDIFIHHEYRKIKDINDILWLGRGLPSWGDPYRWIIIREINSQCEDPELCHNYIQDTFNTMYSDSDSTYLEISRIDDLQSYRYMYKNNYIIGGSYVHSNIVDNRKIYTNGGIWDTAIDTIPNAGGPYISYIYHLEDKDLLFIGLINSPDKDKMIYVKQMETVFKNIK